MNQRPRSVSIVAWMIIILSAITLIKAATWLNNPAFKDALAQSPLPAPVQLGIAFIGPVLAIIAAIAILKGRSWGRLLYIVLGAIRLAVGILVASSKATMLPELVIYSVIIFVLYRPEAKEFFGDARAAIRSK